VTDLWTRVQGLALRLPGSGKRSVSVVHYHETGEFIATACVNVPTGSGVAECAAATGRTWEGALEALEARLKGLG